MAWRREWWSPFLASEISFSSSGLTALALASVVWIRSWSITSRQRLEKSALRCEALRESFPFCRRWRTVYSRDWMSRVWSVPRVGTTRGGILLAGSQRQAPSVQRLLDLLD